MPSNRGVISPVTTPETDGPRKDHLESERSDDHADEPGDHRLEAAEATRLDREDAERGERRDDAGDEQRHARKQQVDADRGADELGEVRGHGDDLGLDPQPDDGRKRKLLAADLRQVEPCRDAQLGAHGLHEHRHEVGREDDPEKHVAVLGTAGDVGREVAWVDVSDCGHESGTEEWNQRSKAARLAVERLFRRAKDTFLTGKRDGYRVRCNYRRLGAPGRVDRLRRRGLNGHFAVLPQRRWRGRAQAGRLPCDP